MRPFARRLRSTWPVALGLYGILALAHALLVPAFGTPDESSHLAYAGHIATKGLPGAEAAGMRGAVATAFYPPLYPLLIAPLTGGLDVGDARNLPAPVFDGGPVHRRVLLIRLFTVLAGAGAVYLTWRIARRVTGDEETALLAALLIGVLPQFSFMSGALNPEVPAAAVAALGFWLLLESRWYSSGIVIGCAALMRPQALGVAAALPALALLQGDPRACRRALAGLALAAAPIIGWGLRNQAEYGQMFLLDTAASTLYDDTERRRSGGPYLEHAVRLFFPSFIGRFRFMDVPLPAVPVTIGLSIWGLGLARGAWLAWRRSDLRPPLGAALASVGGVTAAVLVFYLSYDSPQGRHVFAGLPPLAVVAATGWTRDVPAAGRQALVWAIGAFFAGLTTWALLALEWPAYARWR